MSMAMIRRRPRCVAPWMTLRPTPPQPITATVSPWRMLAVFERRADAGQHAAPDRARRPSRSTSSSIFTSADLGHDRELANVPEHGHLAQRLAVEGEPGRAVEQAAGGHGHAARLAEEPLAARRRSSTSPHCGHPREHDVVADGLSVGRRPRRPPRRCRRPRGRAPSAGRSGMCRSAPTGRSGRRPTRRSCTLTSPACGGAISMSWTSTARRRP